MSVPIHKRSEKRVVRNESARGSISSLPFTRSSSALCLIVAMVVVLIVGCGSEPAPPPPPTPTAVPTVAPTAPPQGSSVEQSTDRGMAPNFSLPSAGGNEVALSGLLEDHRSVVLVFYRGYF